MQQNFAGASNAMIQLQESAAAGDKLVAELIRNAAEQNADLNSKSASELQTLVTTAAANTLLNGALAAGILGQLRRRPAAVQRRQRRRRRRRPGDQVSGQQQFVERLRLAAVLGFAETRDTITPLLQEAFQQTTQAQGSR